MLDIYVCEDNEKQRTFVSNFIQDYCVMRHLDARIVLSASSPEAILETFQKTKNPALFFLDIDLGAAINGVELGRRIREQAPDAFIVFLTTHTEMTLLTFQYKIEALDFIAKDDADRIKQRIAECIDVANIRHVNTGAEKALKVTVDDKQIFINLSDIISIETTHVRHKLRLDTFTRSLEFSGELKKVEAQLNEHFFRIHKSYVVNRKMIVSINKDNTVTMKNHHVIPVSRSGKKLL